MLTPFQAERQMKRSKAIATLPLSQLSLAPRPQNKSLCFSSSFLYGLNTINMLNSVSSVCIHLNQPPICWLQHLTQANKNTFFFFKTTALRGDNCFFIHCATADDPVCSQRRAVRVTSEQISKQSALAYRRTTIIFITASLNLLSQTLTINKTQSSRVAAIYHEG